MAYTQSYEASQPESMFPAADPIHQLPSSNPMDHSQNYPATESAASASGFEMYDDRQERQDTGMTASEEAGDAASRPRLTQEQLAQLERQFALYHKPNTEYKKSLAENMGVDYAKVNVRLHPMSVMSPIDVGHRTGFRIDELKQNMRTRLSTDPIHRSMKPIMFYPRTYHPCITGEPPVHKIPFITPPLSRPQCHQMILPLALILAA